MDNQLIYLIVIAILIIIYIFRNELLAKYRGESFVSHYGETRG